MQDTPATRRWRKLVAEQSESGLSVRAFAESKDIKASTLAWWRSRLKKLESTEAAPAFTAVTVAEPVGTVVLALDDRRAHVVVDEETDLGLLRRVLEAVC